MRHQKTSKSNTNGYSEEMKRRDNEGKKTIPMPTGGISKDVNNAMAKSINELGSENIGTFGKGKIEHEDGLKDLKKKKTNTGNIYSQ